MSGSRTSGPVRIELICEAKHTGVAAQLLRGEMEVTVRRPPATHVASSPREDPATSQPRRTKLLSYSVINLTKLPGRARQEVSHHWSASMPGTIPCASGLSGPQAPLDPGAVENAAGDFLDRNFSGVQQRNGVPLEQRLRRSHFEGHLLPRGVAAVGAALVADLLQPIGLDRQREQLARIGFERARQFRDSRSSSVSG